MADEKIDDAAARKARADAIRRARDRQTAPTGDDDTAAEPTDPSDPNYVAFIDRKMREERERKP